MTRKPILSLALILVAAVAVAACKPKPKPPAPPPPDVYATYGVHNDQHNGDCAYPTCVYGRAPGEPTNPSYPPYWTSNWAMYRVFNNWQTNLPPYAGKPPATLKDGVDYQTSWGTTYYDTTWTGTVGGEPATGAMEEHYEKFCLPIFPIPNNYSCAFISLGKTAFFVTYDDRPSWMPPVCLFSPNNHPPQMDFIKHLPYAVGDSKQLNFTVQGYSFWVGQDGKPMQTGAAPDQTAAGGILFGYAFNSQASLDRVDKTVAPYRHPSSFYFSGVPKLPGVPEPNAPIVSQNYTDFAMVRPDPAKTWDQVANLDPKTLPKCQLFDPPPAANKGALGAVAGTAETTKIPTWGSIGKRR
jgi:hypothetical protein